MRISALAAEAGVPVATVKYYLREGLLHPGVQTSATQAAYDGTHVARLRLVRALVDVGRLSIAAAKQVLACLEVEQVDESLGRVQEQLPPAVGDVDTTAAAAMVGSLGWQVAPGSTAMRQLAVALDAAEAVGLPMSRERLDVYARATREIAETEVGGVPTTSAEEALTYAVVGTVLYEPVVLALRRLAHQDASYRRFGGRRSGLT